MYTENIFYILHKQRDGEIFLVRDIGDMYLLHYRYLLLKSVPNFTQDCKYLTFGVKTSGYIINKNYVMVPHHTWI